MITTIDNGYIVAYQSEGANDKEYQEAIKIMESRPTPPDGYDYRLKADTLEWELYELPSMEGEGDDKKSSNS